MKAKEFMNLPMEKKLEIVNEMLEKEEKDHLKNVSRKLKIPYNTFTKLMRSNGNYHYNQTSKKYEKLMSLEEYESYRKLQLQTKQNSSEALMFIEENLDELKRLLHDHQNQLIIDPIVYNPSSKTINKSFQVNADIYNRFAELCATQFPHLRQRDLISMSLLDFTRRFQNAPTD